MNENEIRALINGVIKAWNGRDLDRFMSLLDETVSWSDPAMLYGPAVGKAAVRDFAESVMKAFPDFTMAIREPICVSSSGERCAIPWVITATHTGRFDPVGFSPTNQVIRMQGVDLIDVVNSKISKIETLFNVIPAAEQALRLKPFPKEGAKRGVIVTIQRVRAWWLRCKTKSVK